MNWSIATSLARASLLLGLFRRRSEISADGFVEILFGHRGRVVFADLLKLLGPRLVSKHNSGASCELATVKGTTVLLDSLLEGQAIQSAKSARACKSAASKRVRFALRDGLLLADSFGGALAIGILLGLRGLGLGFGLRSGFALGVSGGRSFTGDVSVDVKIAIASRKHTRRCSSQLQSSQG